MSRRVPYDPSRRTAHSGEQRLLLDAARLDEMQARARRDLAIERVTYRWRARRRSRAYWAFALPVVAAAAASLWLLSPARTTIAPEPSRHAASIVAARPPILLRPACPSIVEVEPTAALIDDMEDQDANILGQDGRAGTWRFIFDGTGPVTPFSGNLVPATIPSGRGASQMALHVAGGRLSEWGGYVSAALTPAGCYDASAYAGLEFWARGRQRLRVGVVMMDVVPTLAGGPCADNCNQGHVAAIDLTPEWKHYSLRWEDLKQGGSGAATQTRGLIELDLRRLSSVSFGVAPDDTPFDVWLDDLAFLPRQ